VHRLNSAASAALDAAPVRGRIETAGINMVPAEQRAPDYLARLLRAEIEKWAVPIRASGLSVD
jgi:hypothetical protein